MQVIGEQVYGCEANNTVSNEQTRVAKTVTFLASRYI